MADVKTAVLYGGESSEREVSLVSGKCIADALTGEGIDVELFDWRPERVKEFLDCGYSRVYIALHGGSGENGEVQSLLGMAGIAYTGVRPRAAANGMDKHVSKVLVRGLTDVPVPEAVYMPASEARSVVSGGAAGRWDGVTSRIGLPMVVKPARNGSSVGVTIVKDVSAMDAAVLSACVDDDELVMFEQYIKGYELTVAVLNGKALGVCQIIPKNEFYDWDAKYNRNDTEYLTPSALGSEFDAKLCVLAERAAGALECGDGVVRVDFLADEALKPYFLELNTVPGMTGHSLVPKIAAAAGISFGALCRRVLEEAR